MVLIDPKQDLPLFSLKRHCWYLTHDHDFVDICASCCVTLCFRSSSFLWKICFRVMIMLWPTEQNEAPIERKCLVSKRALCNYQYFNILPLIVYRNAIRVSCCGILFGTVLNYHGVSSLIADFPICILWPPWAKLAFLQHAEAPSKENYRISSTTITWSSSACPCE
jgi:hypothetical protein